MVISNPGVFLVILNYVLFLQSHVNLEFEYIISHIYVYGKPFTVCSMPMSKLYNTIIYNTIYTGIIMYIYTYVCTYYIYIYIHMYVHMIYIYMYINHDRPLS